MAVLLETTLGDIVIDLYPEERPRCSLNFIKLCKVKYYNFCLFHSVQRNFMAQTGDPTGTGKGGASLFSQLYGDQAKFFEMENSPRIKHAKKGAVSMVNNGENMHGSQFFFTLAENVDYLDGQHTVFGEVSEGLDILAKINEVFCDKENRPYQDIRINHTIILDDPFDDPEGLSIPDRSPEPTKEQIESGRIGADEELDDTEGKTKDELEEVEKIKESKANAQILEMIGDLPDADIKPPENVLFVCKLNPITTSEDLEVIFSRFGKISSCEVIKDQATENSLCYAFIEFEREEDCEEAYFKMDNVLIDDRRIHVDFSQSVAKLKMNAKGPAMPQQERRPQYAIKDKTSRQLKKYDLVLDNGPDDYHPLAASSSSSNSKKHRRQRSSDKSEHESDDYRHRRTLGKDKKKHRKRDSTPDLSSDDDSRHQKRRKQKKDSSEEEDEKFLRRKSVDSLEKYRDDRHSDRRRHEHDDRKDERERRGWDRDGRRRRKGDDQRENRDDKDERRGRDRDAYRDREWDSDRDRDRDRGRGRDKERDRRR